MDIILVRHALPVRIELETGVADPELSAEGREQASKLAAYLSSESIDAIYASPLRRARETAEPLATQLDRKSTRLNSSHTDISRMPSSA